MSSDQRGRPGGAQETAEDEEARKGSVRAAPKRLQIAQTRTQLPDTSNIIGLPQRPNQFTDQNPYRSRAKEQQQESSSSKSSKPKTITPPPRWPLPNDAAASSGLSPMIPPRSPKRLSSPQQEARPLSDEYPIQQLSPSFPPPTSTDRLQPTSPHYQQSSPVEDMFSPSTFRSPRPLTTSSAASEASSLGSIPDFPVPQPPMPSIPQIRRIPSLGPPPSSRRGPPSYYTQMSYVSPIAEESERSSSALRSRHGSYASSNVFPNHHDDFYGNDDPFSDDDSTITSERSTISHGDQDDRRDLVQQTSPLVRQASLGRRTKPSLMTIKSVDSLGDRNGTTKSKPDGMRSDAAVYGTRNGPSSSSVPTTPLRNVQLAGSLSDFESFNQPPQEEAHATTTLTDRAGMRKPPRLDIDAVRDAEARGSLTSLPELIRRATRLAANLDRGKTASRLGLDFWEAGAPEPKDIRQSGLSDMLAAFPNPGHDTPNSRASRWASPRGESRAGATDSAISNEKPKPRRRCCGMPLWTFITLLMVLLFIIAAAVVIPVVLVVIPKQNNNIGAVQQGQGNNNNDNGNSSSGGNSITTNGPAPTLAPGVNQCDGMITCQNGGIPILNSDRTCNCVCINGFTGSTCANNDATGCTTTSVRGAADNATMGTAISLLLGNTAVDFSIPLNSTRVLSLFSELSLSCAAQNALITFNGLASRSEKQTSRSVDVEDTLEPSLSVSSLNRPHPARALDREVKRQAIGAPGVPAVTTAAQTSATPTQPVSSNVKALDFARVGVLFALQETSQLNVAAKAQESIQSFLTSNRNGNAGSSNLNLGPFKMDLVQLTLVFNNGTTIRASLS